MNYNENKKVCLQSIKVYEENLHLDNQIEFKKEPWVFLFRIIEWL